MAVISERPAPTCGIEGCNQPCKREQRNRYRRFCSRECLIEFRRQAVRRFRGGLSRAAEVLAQDHELKPTSNYEAVLAEVESEMIDAGAWPVRLFEDASEHELTAEAIVTAHPEWRRYIGYIKQIAQRLEERQS